MQRAASAPNFSAFTVATPEIKPVGRRVADQIIHLAPPALGGDRERAIFDKGAVIDEIGDVLARGALVGLAAAFDRGRAVFVERDGVAFDQFGEIGADVIEIEFLFLGHIMGVNLGGLQIEDWLVLHQCRAGLADDAGHPAAMRRSHQMFHLHGFKHGDLLARTDEVPFPDVNRHDRALQRRRHRDRAARPGSRFRDRKRERIVICGVAGFAQLRLGGRLGRPAGCADEIGDMGLDETGADAVFDKIRMGQNRREEWNIGGDAADAELAQGARRLVHDIAPLAAG